ncbi:hypothetical protein ACEWY4_015510 [Coilia grayii]|uniref:MADF domain-containing protein n=1 Tax=Coilia grayii TaxID=363190 RepID=A0ABD1JPS9_9TELE
MWQQYPSLYDVSAREYHDRAKKEKCWQDIALALGQPVVDLQTKAASLRTQYGKLLRPKPSGTGYSVSTPRQQWIERSLGFLRPFMTHRASQTTLNLDDDQMSEVIEDDEEPEAEEPSEPSESSTNPSPPLPVQEHRGRKGKATKQKAKACDLEAEKVEILRAVSQSMIASKEDANEAFGRQLVCELKQVSGKEATYSVVLREPALAPDCCGFDSSKPLQPRSGPDLALIQRLSSEAQTHVGVNVVKTCPHCAGVFREAIAALMADLKGLSYSAFGCWYRGVELLAPSQSASGIKSEQDPGECLSFITGVVIRAG